MLEIKVEDIFHIINYISTCIPYYIIIQKSSVARIEFPLVRYIFNVILYRYVLSIS